MAYTLYADDDKKQITDGSAITATSTKVDGGTALKLSTSSIGTGKPMTARVSEGFNVSTYGSQVFKRSDVFSVLQGAGVTLTSVADNGSGKCRFTLNSHGRSVGDVISISGATAAGLNTVHVITAVPTANTFDTNITYAASGTAGDYALPSGNFATMAVRKFIARRLNDVAVAGQGSNVLRSGGSDYGIRRSIHKVEHLRTYKVTTAIRAGYWNEYTGLFTTAPSLSNDIATVGTDEAATPTRAIPGELVYKTPAPNPVQDNYKAKTG